MVRSAFWLLFAFALAVVFALLLRTNSGNVSILWPPYRVDISRNLALVLAVVGFFVLHVLLLVLSSAFGVPQRLRAYRERRQTRRANRALQGATLAWFEGRFERAERLASNAANNPSTAAVAALIAARSAHRLAAPDRRDQWLRRSAKANPGQSAALLAEAEFALDDRQPERALPAVERLRSVGAEPRLALETSLDAWRRFGRWDQVLDAVRLQSRRGYLSEVELDQLRVEAYEGLLAPSASDPALIMERWRGLRSDERKRRDLAVPTVLALMRAGGTDDARRIAVGILDREFDDTLVECYGAMETISARVRLEQLERWRNRYGDRPRLLEMLGRVCASERVWGKAETYLLQSLAAGDSVSARVALAQLYETIDRRADASRQFQLAARLALGERPAMALMLEPGRMRGAIGAEAPATNPPLAALPGAASAAAGAHHDEAEALSSRARPAPIPVPGSAPGSSTAATAAGGQAGASDQALAGMAAGAGQAPGVLAGGQGAGAPAAASGLATPVTTGGTSAGATSTAAAGGGAASDPTASGTAAAVVQGAPGHADAAGAGASASDPSRRNR